MQNRLPIGKIISTISIRIYSGLILLWLTFASMSLHAQTFYALNAFCSSLVEVNVTASNCECDLTNFVSGPSCTLGETAFCPDGEFYTLGDSPVVGIYGQDLTTGQHYLAYPFPPNVLPLGGQRGMVCVGDGLFYFGWWIATNTVLLFRFNANSGSLTELGVISYDVFGDWAFYDGEIYAFQLGGLVSIDTLNPENSMIVCNLFPFLGGTGITPSPFCNSLLITTPHVDTIYSINLLDCSVVPFCHVAQPLWWINSMLEFEPSPFCTGIIDLDCDNSSGADGSDYNSMPLNCLTEGGVHIADEDINIRIDDVISEMTIELLDPIPDAPDELLIMDASINDIDVNGSGSTLITLLNSGGADMRDFEAALRLVLYVNGSTYPTAGYRTVRVQFTTIAGTMSNTAFAYIEVIELPLVDVNLGPDQTICDGASTIFHAGHPGASYLWSTGDQTQTINVGDEDTYVVTVSDGVNCPGIDTVELEVLPVIHVSLQGDTVGCDNKPVNLFISTDSPFPLTVEILTDPGGSFSFDDVIGHYHFVDFPFENTEYHITDIFPSQPGCIEISDFSQTVEIFPTYTQTSHISLCLGDSVNLGGTWVMEAGDYEVTFSSVHHCDSIIDVTVELLPAVNIFVHESTCDSNELGTFVTYLNNPNGCDTVIQTIIGLFPSDTTYIDLLTCRESESGIFIDTLQGILGCDSVLITAINYASPADTTFLTLTTCDSSTVGEFSQVYTDVLGCDSLVMTTIGYGTADTTYNFITSCDSSSLGVFETHYISIQNCDSIVITNISFSSRDSTFILGASCHPVDTGIFIQTMMNQFGCDSIISTTITFSPSDYPQISGTTCDPAHAGVFVEAYTNQFGCDSIVTETIILLPSNVTMLTATTCNISDVGLYIDTLLNHFGCDSIVHLTVSYEPLDTTLLNFQTCEPNHVGNTEEVYTTSNGCDSIIISITTLFPVPQLILEASPDFNGFDISCYGANDGSINAIVSGTAPWTYLWSTGDTTSIITGLLTGSYSVTLTDGNGCQITDVVLLEGPEPLLLSLEVAQPDCFDKGNGSILVNYSGGVVPVEFSINGSSFQSSPEFNQLSAGTYQITAIDANGCEVNEIIWINTPLTIDVDLGADQTIFLNDSITIQAIVNIPIDSINTIHWSNVDNADCPTCLSQPVSPIVTTTYSVIVTSNDGCLDEDSMTVFLQDDPAIFIPNVFSPNGDQHNDRFLISAGNSVEECISLFVYDRWGNMVYANSQFQPNDPHEAWDGMSRGMSLNPAVFVYCLTVKYTNGEQEVLYGTVTLLK